MSEFPPLNPAPPMLTRKQALLAAQGATAVWGILAMLFGLATLSGGPKYLVLGLAAVAMAVVVDRRKSMALAILTFWVAALLSIVGFVLFLGGRGNWLLVPFFAMPLAVGGLRGARALRDLPPSFRVDLRV